MTIHRNGIPILRTRVKLFHKAISITQGAWALFQKARANTVFNRMDTKTLGSDKILAILFHRASATGYFITTIWGAFAFAIGIPAIQTSQGAQFSTLFAALVIICAAPAMCGAATFPRHARIELFAGAAFASLIVVYCILLLATASEVPARITQSILICYFLVGPLARSAFIYLTLIRHAEQEHIL